MLRLSPRMPEVDRLKIELKAAQDDAAYWQKALDGIIWDNAVLVSKSNKLERRVATQRRRITRLIEIAKRWKRRAT